LDIPKIASGIPGSQDLRRAYSTPGKFRYRIRDTGIERSPSSILDSWIFRYPLRDFGIERSPPSVLGSRGFQLSFHLPEEPGSRELVQAPLHSETSRHQLRRVHDRIFATARAPPAPYRHDQPACPISPRISAASPHHYGIRYTIRAPRAHTNEERENTQLHLQTLPAVPVRFLVHDTPRLNPGDSNRPSISLAFLPTLYIPRSILLSRTEHAYKCFHTDIVHTAFYLVKSNRTRIQVLPTDFVYTAFYLSKSNRTRIQVHLHRRDK